MTADTKYFEDFTIGERFHTPGKTITDAHFLFFAGLTGDNHPIHYDDEYAKGTRFGQRLAHGLLLMAMTAAGASSLSAQMEESVVAFVEQSSTFRLPVMIGDTITPMLEVIELVPKTNVGLVRLAASITNQRGETVLDGTHAYLIRNRP
jgi:acyl dehydratase